MLLPGDDVERAWQRLRLEQKRTTGKWPEEEASDSAAVLGILLLTLLLLLVAGAAVIAWLIWS